MKKLNRKIFFTIFSLISSFLIVGIVLYNVQNYKREYENVERNLNKINRMMPEDRSDHIHKEFDNMIIMDYEVYTVYLNNNEIDKIVSHSNSTSDFNIDSIANQALKSSKNTNVGNLYINKYSYNKMNNTIVIINTKNINSKLTKLLVISAVLLVLLEIIIYFISKLITDWITKPALDSFKKQKEFIADASHELKTPLSIIMASSDELSGTSNQKYIDNIKYESDRMNKLITNLLDLSKLENGSSKQLYENENISKIVNKICLTFESVAYEKSVGIDTDIEDNINYKCIKEDIEKLISILIDNAIKHSYKDTNIKVIMHKKKNSINIEVINSGDAIKKEDEEKIFERFYRVDKSRNRSNNRYGLGLAIAKSIVINHNGSIEATSSSDKTVFRVVLK